MNEEDKIILFGRYSADALNNENLFLYADGELIEERTPIHLKDKRLADEIGRFL